MRIIEDKGVLTFYEGDHEISHQEGFAYLNQIYPNETAESKKAINRLKEKYGSAANYERSIHNEA